MPLVSRNNFGIRQAFLPANKPTHFSGWWVLLNSQTGKDMPAADIKTQTNLRNLQKIDDDSVKNKNINLHYPGKHNRSTSHLYMYIYTHMYMYDIYNMCGAQFRHSSGALATSYHNATSQPRLRCQAI